MTPTFDLGDPAFDVTSAQVHAAREDDWYVETTWGWAVLRAVVDRVMTGSIPAAHPNLVRL